MDHMKPFTASYVKPFKPKSKLDGSGTDCKRVATIDQRVLQDTQPGDSYTSDQWMRTVIKEFWKLLIHIWKQKNTELHGTDSAISLERRCKERANEAAAVYQNTIGKISQRDSIVLHHSRVEAIIKWNQEHLDAYLQSADIIIEQRDEAG
jgi:hypothetical protein